MDCCILYTLYTLIQYGLLYVGYKAQEERGMKESGELAGNRSGAHSKHRKGETGKEAVRTIERISRATNH